MKSVFVSAPDSLLLVHLGELDATSSCIFIKWSRLSEACLGADRPSSKHLDAVWPSEHLTSSEKLTSFASTTVSGESE
jgi:hypothetical protein